MTRDEIKKYIENLQGYEGYIQYSNRPLSYKDDIFIIETPKVEEKTGFIYEAHFCNGKQSIAIKQINDHWLISKTDISTIEEKDIQTYISDIEGWNYKVKMAQVWEERSDELCESMNVMKLQKVVFAGFEKGESK